MKSKKFSGLMIFRRVVFATSWLETGWRRSIGMMYDLSGLFDTSPNQTMVSLSILFQVPETVGPSRGHKESVLRTEAFPVNDFTDPAASDAYAKALATKAAATKPEELAKAKDDADKFRDQALLRGPLLEAACTYLVMAQAGITVGKADPERFYHFAANAFRGLGLLQHAAECYFNAALIGYQRYKNIGNGSASFTRRSAGRAKTMFSEVGDDDNSDDAHVLQQRTRLTELRRERRYFLAFIYWLWAIISGFGTSPTRWLVSTLITVVAFAILYPLLICWGDVIAAGEVQRSGWALFSSALYFSIGNLFQFGTLGTLTPKSGLAHIVAIVHGVFAFILVGTGATFLSKR